jgi:hypothetical protein
VSCDRYRAAPHDTGAGAAHRKRNSYMHGVVTTHSDKHNTQTKVSQSCKVHNAMPMRGQWKAHFVQSATLRSSGLSWSRTRMPLILSAHVIGHEVGDQLRLKWRLWA